MLSVASVFLGFWAWRRKSTTPFMRVPLRPYTSPVVAFPGPEGGYGEGQGFLAVSAALSCAAFSGRLAWCALELRFLRGSDSRLPYLLPCRDLPGFVKSLQGLFLKRLKRAVSSLFLLMEQLL